MHVSADVVLATRTAAPSTRAQGTSANWAGYILTGRVFTAVTGAWTVPSVSYVRYPGWSGAEVSSTWIGIGGNTSDATLIQLGTTQAIDANGTVKYSAWYLLVDGLNNPALDLPNPVSPGDRIEATLQCVANCTPNATQSWKMTIRNRTKNWFWDNNGATFSYRSSLASADWIMEAATRQQDGQIAHLPKYGSVKFENATANGANPNLSLLRDGLSMVNPNGIPISIPTAATGGNSFVVNQVNLPPSPPLPNTPGRNACRDGTDLGEFTVQNRRSLQGTIEAINGIAYYRFYTRQYFHVQAVPLGTPPWRYSFTVVDDITGREMQTINGPQDLGLSIDPGYYCIKIFRSDGPQPVPYNIDMSVAPVGGFIPPANKAGAFPLSMLELGNLSQNGY